MTAGGRLAVAGGCAVAGMLAVWAVQYSVRVGRGDSFATRLVSTPRAIRTAAVTRSVLWLLAIGVSRYQHPELNLQFADVDARAIATILQHQADGPLYRETRSLVLTNEEVTRESILNSLENIVHQAGPDDVAVIFLAGHGVQDLATGSYYFLPYAASADNLLTVGLRMSDFDEMIRLLRRNVRGVVVMLDTCHAGALPGPSSGFVGGGEPAAQLSAGEGFFLLAATKPGEESKEKPELKHGAFTYALLEGLQGAADTDGDGLISVSDLFGYVARRVPRLTNGAQHPYHKVEGTDLTLAAVKAGLETLVPAVVMPASEPITVAPVEGTSVNTIGVMEFRDLQGEPEHEWIGEALRVAFNTELSKVRALRVYAPELIDRTAQAHRSDILATAQRLGIQRVVTGSYHVVGKTIRMDAAIIDTTTGVQEGSDSVEGHLSDFFALQKKLVLSMLHRLQVQVSPEEGSSIQKETNTNVDAYRLLLEAEGIVDVPTPSPSPQPQSRLELHRWFSGLHLAGRAFAEEPATDVTTEVRRVLEEYRRAHELKDLDRLAALYVSFSERQRKALREYLDNARDLTVELSDISVQPHEKDMVVSFTRRDHFVDKESGKPVRLEVRLTKVLVRENGQWKIAGAR
jgi:uncharacterized caspase-like protein/TolB-like protein